MFHPPHSASSVPQSLYEGEQFACQSPIQAFVWPVSPVWSIVIFFTVIIIITPKSVCKLQDKDTRVRHRQQEFWGEPVVVGLGSKVTSYACLSMQCDNVLSIAGRTPKDTHLFSQFSLKNCQWSMSLQPATSQPATVIKVRWERKQLKTKNKAKTYYWSSVLDRKLSVDYIFNHQTQHGKKTKTHYKSYYWWWWWCRKLKFIGAPPPPSEPSDGPWDWLWFMQMMWDTVHEEGSSSSW